MRPPDADEALNIARLARAQVVTQHLTMPRLDVARAICTGGVMAVWVAVGWMLLAQRPMLHILVAAIGAIPMAVAMVALRKADEMLREARYVACRAYDFMASYAERSPQPATPVAPDVRSWLAKRDLDRSRRRRQDN